MRRTVDKLNTVLKNKHLLKYGYSQKKKKLTFVIYK